MHRPIGYIYYVAHKAHTLCYMALHSFFSRDPLFLGSVFQLFIRPSLEYAIALSGVPA